MAPIGKYNIKAISTIVGIQPGTLRAWERRYHIIKPVRNDAGHRLYTEEHVHILKWLIQKINEGFTIGQAVNLYETKGKVNSFVEPIQLDRAEVLTNNIVTSLIQFEEMEAHKYVDEVFSLFSFEKVLFEVLLKVLMKIEEMKKNRQIKSSHEHFAISFLKTRIGTIYHHSQVFTSFPKIVAVCGPGEKHDVGLMILATFLRRRGFQVFYLGASMEKEDIIFVLDEVNPKCIVFSCTTTENLNETIKIAKELNRHYPELKIGLSDTGSLNETDKKENLQYIIGNSNESFRKWIEENLSI